tara:strand:- start:1181 stop:3001 length:1821 start_codon:yes stop_codon:yes gene_type:complete
MNKKMIVTLSLGGFMLSAQDFSKQWEYIEAYNQESNPLELIEVWEYFYQKPINLNDLKEIEQLETLYLLTDHELKIIIDYCKTNNLLSKYQLQILDIEIESLKRVKDFVSVPQTNTTSTKISSDFFTGIQFIRPLQKGTKNKEYLGSPFKIHYRYRTDLQKGWRLGLNLEKDHGEPFYYKKYDINNLAFYFQFQGKGKLKSLLFGKYDINIGEGLVFGTSYRINNPYFLSYSPIDITKASLSSKEYNYFEGAASEWKIKDLSINLFASHKKLNGTSNIDKTGLYRTETEIKKRRNIKENLVGLILNIEKNKYKISLSNLIYQSNFEDFNTNYIQSFYLSKSYYNIKYSSETVVQNFTYWASIQKLTISASNNSLISVQFRTRKHGFFNQYKSDYSHFSNGYENGILWCFQHNFDKKWQFRATFDHFNANFVKKHTSQGRAIYTQISRNTEKRKMRIQFQYKYLYEAQKKSQFRLFYQEYLNSNTRVNIKGNYTFNLGHLNTSMQTNLYQTSRNKKNKINISYCAFHATNSSTFWQGPYFYGSFNSRFLYGKGTVTTLSYQRKIYKTILGIQMNHMRYADRDEIGSGNEQTNKPYKSEISLYLKWKN